jgi:putative ABC transport system substrate-binding protein
MKIGRRDFISLLGGALMTAPRRARAQADALAVIGFLHPALVESYVSNAPGFARGLQERGFAEAQNVAIEYRFANGRLDELKTLAADLVGQQPAVIVAGGAAAALAAKAATLTIPIVFVTGFDPVDLGLVAGRNPPGSNMTGVAFTTSGLMARKLGLLRELVPGTTRVGYLAEDGRAYPSGSAIARGVEKRKREMLAAGSAAEIVVAEIGSDHDYGTAFDSFVARRAGAIIVAPSAVLANDADEIIALAERNKIPAMFERRADVIGGGLIAFGASRTEAWRQCGIRVAEILGGVRPADMPVVRSEKLELTIHRATANALGLTIPPGLLARADEVI